MYKGSYAANWPVDYSRDVIDVFQDAVRHIVLETESLDIICHCLWPDEFEHKHTWIPRFTGEFGDCCCSTFEANSLTVSEILLPEGETVKEMLPNCSAYDAAASTPAEVIFDIAGRRLIAKGMMVDKIDRVFDKPTGYRGGFVVPQQWKQAYYNPQEFETFWRTLVADRQQLSLGGEVEPDLDADELLFNRGFFDLYIAKAPSEWGEECMKWLEGDMTVPYSSTSEFLKGVSRYNLNRRLVTTGKSSMGLVPEVAETGDLVCVLMGCSVPVILRPVLKDGQETGHFNLVGEAYIHGIMDGEAVEMEGKGELRMRDFSII